MEDNASYITSGSCIKDKIINRLKSDIDYIPSYEEYLLISDSRFSLGSTPIYKLELVNSEDVSKLDSVEKKTREIRPGGMTELFDCLKAAHKCSSYSESYIYYMAYLLSSEDILVNVYGQEYRNKFLQRSRIVDNYKKMKKGGQ